MDPNPVLGVLFRWLHIASVVILVGGIFHARFCAEQWAPRFRPFLYGAMAVLLGSGLFNLLTKPALPEGYHMWFGIKMLLVLHIFGVGLMVGTPAVEPARRRRWMTGIVASAAAVLLISAWLRWISLA